MVILVFRLVSYTASDFGILFNQTSYTVVVDRDIAHTGIPLVSFTVYFSEPLTSSSLLSSWSSSLSSIEAAHSHFDVPLSHIFPNNSQPPLADSDAIVVNPSDPPEPGSYIYNLQVAVVISFTEVVTQSVVVNITIIETPGE